VTILIKLLITIYTNGDASNKKIILLFLIFEEEEEDHGTQF
jgi:hypothetical protein